ncbi:MAG TPA: hypothetical protein PKA00_04065 [Saprospiraceae bacterium]|nr:hypothetical protein [Saprospiraceae bacterium]HMQ82054.1 hypothetical protein [Saprospiraceae bacterium]
MKKPSFFFAGIILAFSLLGCAKEEHVCPENDLQEIVVILYNDNVFSGNSKEFSIFNFDQGECVFLGDFGIEGEPSSVRYSLPPGIVVTLWASDACGNAANYEMRGVGENPFLSDQGFDNIAASLKWDTE